MADTRACSDPNREPIPPPTAPAAPQPATAVTRRQLAPLPRRRSGCDARRRRSPRGSLVAPTAYKLYDPETYQTIDYLYTTATNLDFSRYDDMRIIATGEESLDQRWPNTPMLTVESIQVIDTDAVKVIPHQAQPH